MFCYRDYQLTTRRGVVSPILNTCKISIGYQNIEKVRIKFTCFIFLIGLALGKVRNPNTEHNMLRLSFGLCINFRDYDTIHLVDTSLLENEFYLKKRVFI